MQAHKLQNAGGVALALAAAGLFAGCAAEPKPEAAAADVAASSSAAMPQKGVTKAESTDMVHCYGVNICGGHNDCKTEGNSCAGQASCNGTGFVGMPSKACADIGGKQKDDWMGSIAKADLVHCYGVNICGGHNDCKTADNSCAGQASCNGTGFVSMPAKACADVGGKVGA